MSQDDGRPAGGMARTPGNRTPARVRWAGAQPSQGLTTIHAIDHALPSSEGQLELDDMRSHALDEHGRDPDALKNLTDALERHRSTSRTRTTVPALPPLAIPSPSHSPPHQQPSQTPSNANTTTDSTFTSPSSTAPPSPTHDYDLPGELYISPDETHGLPGAGIDNDDLERTAKTIVRAHTRTKKGMGRFTHMPASSISPPKAKLPKPPKIKSRVRNPMGMNIPFLSSASTAAASTPSSDIDLTDVESIGHQTPPPAPPIGGGVLSALLTLYDHENGGASGASTPATAPVSPAESSSSDHEDDIRSFPVKRGWRSSLHHLSSFNPRNLSQKAVGSSISASASAAALPPAPIPEAKRPSLGRKTFSLDLNLPKQKFSFPTHKNSNPSPPTFMHRSSSAETEDEDNITAANTSANRSRSNSWDEMEYEKRQSWTGVFKHHANGSVQSLKSIGFGIGIGKYGSTGDGVVPTGWEEREKYLAREKEKREKRRKKRKQEAFITRHVADIIQRQEFILKLVRAFMMFGAPSHRLVAQMQATGHVLSIELSCMYLPDIMLISFDDASTGTSNLKFIRQASSLDLGKLHLSYGLYWRVIHDDLLVSEATKELDVIMRSPPVYKPWQLVLIGGVCSSAISIVSFGGSFIDGVVSFPLGALLVAIQLMSVKNELYSNVFEITVALLLSFLSAILSSTKQFCYPAVTSGAVVLILPGYITLVGALELNSRSIVSGAVRIGYALIYSLFLGFGLAIGAEIYEKAFNSSIYGADDFQCALTHGVGAPWYRQTPSVVWAVLLVPLYSCALSMRNHQPWNRKELYLSIAIAAIGWVTDHFTSLKFPNQSDISAAVGAFAVGVVANMYGRFVKSGNGNAFVVMITGIMFQLPSGLGPNGLLAFASQQTSGTSNAYLSGFQTALQLISVGIGLTVGLSISLVVVHPFQSRKRGGGVFSL